MSICEVENLRKDAIQPQSALAEPVMTHMLKTWDEVFGDPRDMRPSWNALIVRNHEMFYSTILHFLMEDGTTVSYACLHRHQQPYQVDFCKVTRCGMPAWLDRHMKDSIDPSPWALDFEHYWTYDCMDGTTETEIGEFMLCCISVERCSWEPWKCFVRPECCAHATRTYFLITLNET